MAALQTERAGHDGSSKSVLQVTLLEFVGATTAETVWKVVKATNVLKEMDFIAKVKEFFFQANQSSVPFHR
jgi:hypothetical protein